MGLCSSTTSSTTTVPQYVSDASQEAVSQAENLPAYNVPALQVAGLTPDQQTAITQAGTLAANPNVTTSRVVDQNGPLGATSDYVDPYAAAALDPSNAAISLDAAQQRKALGAAATSAGAFGDARHGVDESQINFNENTAIGNNTKTGMEDAYTNAMSERETDLSRFATVDQNNISNALQATQALLNAGGEEQSTEQAQNLATFNNFLAQYQGNFEVLTALEQAIGGVKDTTTTTNKSDSGAIESLLGAAVGGFTGGVGKAVGTAAVAAA